jgi:hypothetical protein
MGWIIAWILIVLIIIAFFNGADIPCEDCDVYIEGQGDCSRCDRRRSR